jgi:enoyl-CoA hydratase
VTAEEGLQIGLVDRIYPHEELNAKAIELAAELARGPLAAHSLAKLAIDEGLELTLQKGIALEQDLFAEVSGTEDAAIGVASFLENGPGKAKFVGR